MGKSIPVKFSSMKFSSKQDAKDFFKEILGKYSDGDQIDDDDSALLFELIQRHPDNERLTGFGIKYFFRDRSTDHPTSCFHIKRVDLTSSDFSYPRCIEGREPTVDDYFYRACRQAVTSVLIKNKNELFDKGPVYCSLSGEEVTKETSEYRHTTPSFSEIVRTYKKKKGICAVRELFVERRDMQYTVEFKDQSIANDFLEYHQSIARLDIFKK